MRKNRLLLCFLLAIVILFYGVPFLQLQGELLETLFSSLWLLFALIAISGNLVALLYGQKLKRNETRVRKSYKQIKQKVRQYQ